MRQAGTGLGAGRACAQGLGTRARRKGAAGARGAQGAQAGSGGRARCDRGVAGARDRRARGALCTGAVRAAMRGLGVLLGQQAVYSACFDPVSTQYCS